MVTAEERDALRAVACNWCGAAPGEDCHVKGTADPTVKGTRRYNPLPLTTLDGGAHDARWRTALSRPATVITAAVPHPDPVSPGDGRVPLPVGVVADEGRPW